MTNALPEPLLPPEVDLRDFPYMPLVITRLFNSEFHARATDSEWRAGVTLWLKAFHLPGASLPDDDVQLARLAEFGRDIKGWQKVKTMALHGWVKCTDGRLHHRVVAEVAQQSWLRKLEQRERTRKARDARQRARSQKGGGSDDTEHVTTSVTENVTEPVITEYGSVTDNATTSVTASKGREGKGREGKLALSSDTQNLDRPDSGTAENQNFGLSRIIPRPLHGPDYHDPANRRAFADKEVAKVLAERVSAAESWMIVLSARDPTDPDHAKNRRECEKIARSIAVVWEPDPEWSKRVGHIVRGESSEPEREAL